jgi:hypothetical protein
MQLPRDITFCVRADRTRPAVAKLTACSIGHVSQWHPIAPVPMNPSMRRMTHSGLATN